MDTFFSFIAVSLQCLCLVDLSLNLLQLLTQVFSGLSGFKLVLLDCVKTSLQHLDLSVGTIRLSLSHVDALKRVLVSLSELD